MNQPRDRRLFLKIKLKSLMEEAKIIRKAENSPRNLPLLGELHHHRVMDVRTEARHTHIAYGLIRGRELHEMEKTEKPVDWKKVQAMCKKYGPPLFHHPLFVQG